MSVNDKIVKLAKINSFDFNLLIVFETIFIYSSVSIAASKLDSSPSSISQSLNKLRTYFSDPLFVRKGQGLVPTTVAVNLHEKVSFDLGNLVSNLVNINEPGVTNKFVIYSSPYTAQIFLPEICSIIEKDILPYELSHISADATLNVSEDMLTYRKVDIVFDTIPFYNNSINTMLYKEEKILAVCKKTHPRLDATLNKDDMRREKFTIISMNTQGVKLSQGIIENFCGPRDIFFCSSAVEVNAAITAQTECVSFVTESFYQTFGSCYNLKSLEYDFEIDPIRFYLSYNKSSVKNSNFMGFIELITKNFSC